MITLNVPSIACEVCANTITKAIQNSDPEAIVNINVATKVVQVGTTQTLDTIKEVIMDAGHTVS